MSHPIPGHDYSEQHNEETDKEYAKRVREGSRPKKKSMAKKMFNVHGKVMKGIMDSILNKKTPKWFKEGQGGGGLPPGRKDSDNE